MTCSKDCKGIDELEGSDTMIGDIDSSLLDEYVERFTTKKSCDGNLDVKCKQRIKKKSWKRPLDKPKRPACAYNLFFHLQREKLLNGCGDDRKFSVGEVARAASYQRYDKPRRKHVKTHGIIGFKHLSRKIAESWRNMNQDDRQVFYSQAKVETERYSKNLELWQSRVQNSATIFAPNSKESIVEFPTLAQAKSCQSLISKIGQDYSGLSSHDSAPVERDLHLSSSILQPSEITAFCQLQDDCKIAAAATGHEPYSSTDCNNKIMSLNVSVLGRAVPTESEVEWRKRICSHNPMPPKAGTTTYIQDIPSCDQCVCTFNNDRNVSFPLRRQISNAKEFDLHDELKSFIVPHTRYCDRHIMAHPHHEKWGSASANDCSPFCWTDLDEQDFGVFHALEQYDESLQRDSTDQYDMDLTYEFPEDFIGHGDADDLKKSWEQARDNLRLGDLKHSFLSGNFKDVKRNAKKVFDFNQDDDPQLANDNILDTMVDEVFDNYEDFDHFF
jgi:HMG-box domain